MAAVESFNLKSPMISKRVGFLALPPPKKGSRPTPQPRHYLVVLVPGRKQMFSRIETDTRDGVVVCAGASLFELSGFIALRPICCVSCDEFVLGIDGVFLGGCCGHGDKYFWRFGLKNIPVLVLRKTIER